MNDGQKNELAQKRADDKIAFYVHATIFVAVNLLLIAINVTTSPETIWFIWPLIGWGTGLLGHGYLVYNPPEKSNFRQKLIEKELAKLEETQKPELTWKQDTNAPHS